MQNEARLRTEKISSLLARLAAPAICAQLVALLYNLADRIYLGRAEDGLLLVAAVGVCAPIVSIITAFTGLLGRGGAPLAAISLGRQDRAQAEAYLGNSFALLVVSSVVITGAVLAFRRPLLALFGASEETLPYAMEYLTIYITGTLFVQLTVGMNYYITTQGFARTAMATTMLGAGLNILLDPLFIYGFGMGAAGAALATVLSQFASFLWVLGFLFDRRTSLRIRREGLRLRWSAVGGILSLGAAPFFMQLSEGVLNICFNRQAQRFGGDMAVTAMTVLFSVFQLLLLPVEGLAQGSQPIISYNYGAGEFDRVQRCVRLAVTAALAFTLVATGVVMLWPDLFIRLFNSDPQLISMGRGMLRVYVAGLFILGLNSTCQQTYTSLGEGRLAFFFAFLRKIILLIPLLYLLPAALDGGLLAVVLAEPIADVITTVSNGLFFRRFLRRKLPEQADR